VSSNEKFSGDAIPDAVSGAFFSFIVSCFLIADVLQDFRNGFSIHEFA